MKDTDDYELFDKDFDEWIRLGRKSFGMEWLNDDHPGAVRERED